MMLPTQTTNYLLCLVQIKIRLEGMLCSAEAEERRTAHLLVNPWQIFIYKDVFFSF